MAIWVIAKLTIKEAIRRRIVLVGVVLGIVLLGFHAAGFGFIKAQIETSGSQSAVNRTEFYNFLTMSGFYAVNFLALMLVGLMSANALAGEINSGAVQTMAVKPVRRVEIVFGKWLGLALLGAGYLLLMMGGMCLSVWLQTRYLPPNILTSVLLVYLDVLLIETVALAGSSRLSTLATGGLIFGLFGVAFVGGWVEQIGSFLESQSAVELGILSSLVFPGEAVWRRAAYLMSTNLIRMIGGPFISNSVPSPMMVVYAVVYLIAAFLLGAWLFSRRDL